MQNIRIRAFANGRRNVLRSRATRHRLFSSLAVLAIATAGSLMAPGAWALDLTAGDETELRNAIAAAAASTDATSTITLTGPITLASTTAFAALNGKAITINTDGHSISAPDGNNPGTSLTFDPSPSGGTLTIAGDGQVGEGLFGGSASGGGVNGGNGLTLQGVTVVNNGAITGGANGTLANPSIFGGNIGGAGLRLTGGTLANNGVITGGDSTGTGGPGIGVVLDGGTNHVNNGTIQGGLIHSNGQNSTWGLDMNNTTLTNNGIIHGAAGGTANSDGVNMRGNSTIINNADGEIYGTDGTPTVRAGDGLSLFGTGITARIVNDGVIRGGDNSTATGQPSFGIVGTVVLGVNPLSTVEIVNSGQIIGGSGGNTEQVAIGMAGNFWQLTLELRSGTDIQGAVNARTNTTDTLRLGGDEDETFDVSLIGNAAPAQYRNFDVFEKTGASTWNITGVQTGVTPWDIYAGNFQVALGANTGPGNVDLIGGTLSGLGTVGATNAAANTIISPGIETIDRRGVLTINGAYAGNNNFLEIQTVLGDDNSDTDLLRINGGTAAGTTFVRVTNDSGTGAQTNNGIKIVDVEGGASDGDFELLGDLVVNGQQAVLGGAFAYSLFQGTPTTDDGDWYLRSIGFTPSATAYESYAGVLLGLIDMPTMQQRVGNVYMPNAGSATDGYVNPEPVADVVPEAPPPANFWTRFEAAFGHHEGDSDTGTEYDLDRYRVQVGIDGRLGESADGIFIAGINAQYGHADADLESDTGNGDNSTDSFGGGLTLTWVSASGFYADAQGQVHYLESDLSSDALGDLVDNNEGWGYGLSLELGRKVTLDEAVSLTPQAQLYYTSVDFDDFTDNQGVDVSLDEGESLKGRVGLALNYDSFGDGDTRGHVYGIANLTYEFLDAQSVDVAGVDVEFEPEELGGELGIGGTYEWSGGQHAIHAEALGQTSFEGSYGVKGNIGFSTRF